MHLLVGTNLCTIFLNVSLFWGIVCSKVSYLKSYQKVRQLHGLIKKSMNGKN